jgi:cell division protein FtsL
MNAGRRHQTGNPLPARYMVFGVLIVAVLISFPLFLVWRQAFITTSAVHQEKLADSLTTLNRQVLQLRGDVERFAAAERIERIARETLHLEYPVSQQIVIVRPDSRPQRAAIGSWHFFTVLRKSLEQGRS